MDKYYFFFGTGLALSHTNVPLMWFQKPKSLHVHCRKVNDALLSCVPVFELSSKVTAAYLDRKSVV